MSIILLFIILYLENKQDQISGVPDEYKLKISKEFKENLRSFSSHTGDIVDGKN